VPTPERRVVHGSGTLALAISARAAADAISKSKCGSCVIAD
jgi:hypothetical protein